jgi:lysophospholipase L1-like esterase
MAYRRQYLGDFERAQREHPSWPVVVSEGDSWFSFSDVIGRLDDPTGTADPKKQRPWALLRLEKNGDEILAILSGGQRSLLRKIFARWRTDALLFSGGGNDIIGPDLLPLLREWRSGATAQDLIHRSRFDRRLRQIADCYRELMDLIADSGQSTKVFANSYDYVIPSNRPVKLLGLVKIAGPWMIQHFATRKIPKSLQPQILRILIDDFCAAVDQVAAEPGNAGRLLRVDTRVVVVDQWRDEIHPNRKGAIRVAKAFETVLRGAGVIA